MTGTMPNSYRRMLLGAGLLIATLGIASPLSAAAAPLTLSSNKDTAVSTQSTPTIEQKLQIKQLRQETSWPGRLQGYLPAGTALVALGAAAWGIFVYLRDQRRDLALRTQMEISTNLNRLTEHSKGETVNSSQVVTCLSTLNSLADQAAERDELLTKVTEVITTAVTEDISFDDVTQVRFETLCLASWAPYAEHLNKNPDEHRYVLYRYLSAVHELRTRHEDYVTMVNWNSNTKNFTHPTGQIMEPEDDFRLFQRLAQGIRSHWQLIDDTGRQNALAGDFRKATGNAELTTQLLKGPR